jgi:NAD(P)-dependent dehydrogenase (short-subunit alcohol dehydrogenase family)|tara:strand:- start:4102 stop:4878 length:777 start_codon:yes stop_codon:yes gene_type:complete
MDRVTGKTALISGGAAGIGRSISELLANQGAHVVITDVNIDAGKKAAEEIGKGVAFMAHDVTDETAWKKVIAQTIDGRGGLDILVNNAGIGSPNVRPENADLAQWRQVQSVNLEGTFLGCKYGIAAMQAGSGGSIINISSIAAFVPTAGDLVYGASKAAVLQLTRSLALHCAQTNSNIRVNSIHPGAIRTSGVEARRSPEILRQVEGGIPMGRMGEPEDIAYAALYLASDESKYVTGMAMIVDGGYVLAPVPPSAPDH